MNLLANHSLATLQLNKSTNWQHIYISLRRGTRSNGMKIQKLDTITTLAGGRKEERCGGRFLRGVWWFLNWLLPPQSHPAWLGEWISQTGMADALPISAGWGRSCGMCQGAAGCARELQVSPGPSPLLALAWGWQGRGPSALQPPPFLCSHFLKGIPELFPKERCISILLAAGALSWHLHWGFIAFAQHPPSFFCL